MSLVQGDPLYFHWSLLLTCTVIPNYTSHLETKLYANSKYRPGHYVVLQKSTFPQNITVNRHQSLKLLLNKTCASSKLYKPCRVEFSILVPCVSYTTLLQGVGTMGYTANKLHLLQIMKQTTYPPRYKLKPNIKMIFKSCISNLAFSNIAFYNLAFKTGFPVC